MTKRIPFRVLLLREHMRHSDIFWKDGAVVSLSGTPKFETNDDGDTIVRKEYRVKTVKNLLSGIKKTVLFEERSFLCFYELLRLRVRGLLGLLRSSFLHRSLIGRLRICRLLRLRIGVLVAHIGSLLRFR